MQARLVSIGLGGLECVQTTVTKRSITKLVKEWRMETWNFCVTALLHGGMEGKGNMKVLLQGT